jgi:hypothetical protein
MRKAGQAKTTTKKKRPTSTFLEAHVLGIMAYFSDEIDSVTHPAAEKLRSIRAIEEVIALSKSAAGIALPQVSSCADILTVVLTNCRSGLAFSRL